MVKGQGSMVNGHLSLVISQEILDYGLWTVDYRLLTVGTLPKVKLQLQAKFKSERENYEDC